MESNTLEVTIETTLEPLNSSNVYQYAIKHYKNIEMCDYNEFIKDYRQVATLNKYFYNYELNRVIKTQRVLNVLISFYNVFYEETEADRLLFFFIKPEYQKYVKVLLLEYFHRCPEHVFITPKEIIHVHELPVDEEFACCIKA
jgi:hypothetical protein